MAYPDFSLPFELNTDASSTGIGFALCQTQDGKHHAITYGGPDLNPAERNYSTKCEALVIVEGIKKFRNYLYGRKFVINTDHHALRWLMSIKDPSQRLARLALLVQQYDFTIEYKSGKQNLDADVLSRRPYSPQLHSSAYDLAGVPIERIRDLQRQDPELSDLITFLETDALPPSNSRARSFVLCGDKFYLDENGLLFSLWTPSKRTNRDVCSQLVILDALKHEVLVWAHDDVTAGHLGTQKTYGKIRTRYYWRSMFRDIDRWCKSCVDCAMKKSPRNRHKAPLLPIPVENAFDRLAVDCLGPFPLSNAGNRYVVVFTEYLTHWPEAFAVPIPMLKLSLASLLITLSSNMVLLGRYCLIVEKIFSHRLFDLSANFLTQGKSTPQLITHKRTVLLNDLTTHFANPCQCTSAVTKKTGTPIYQRFCLVFELVLIKQPEIVHSTCCMAVNQDFPSMFLSFPRLK